jgi:glycosyltransferase involved in cell wall biosynthesis
MRVLVVSQYFWPENFRINEIAESLLGAGCTVDVLTGPPNYPDGKVFPGYSATALNTENRAGVTVHRVPVVPRGRGTALRLMLNYVSFVVCGCLFGPWLLRRRQVDLVLVYAPGPILQAIPGLWLGLLKGARVTTWVQDLWPESLETTGFVRNKWVLALVSTVVRWIYRRNDLLLVQSRSFIEPVSAMAGGTPVRYHPNPGELPIAATARPPDEPTLRLKAGFNVVFAGNLGTVQALDTILSAAERTREVSDLWWVIVGSGSRGDWLREEVGRRQLAQVVLPGRFAPEAMPAILKQASALLVSLVRDPIMSQTIPSKVQAYLGSGKPIVAALDGEAARVVTEAGAGIACPAEDAAALCEAVMRLRAMPPEDLQRLGDAGREYYRRHFDPQVLTGRLLECFRQLLSDAAGERIRARSNEKE